MTAADAESRAVIAGTGIAGAVAACELRRRGFDVWMLEATHVRAPGATRRDMHDDMRRDMRGIEALPAAAVAALGDLGLTAALARAGAVAAHGFDNAWGNASRPTRVDGTWHYVERTALARALRDAAIERGARILPMARVPRLVRDAGAGPFRWDAGGLPPVSRIAIDATGRAARWSRPVIRRDAQVAALFRGPGVAAQRRGRTVRTEAGWAYALFHPEATTVGVVTAAHRAAPPAALTADLAAALGLASPETFAFDRRCVAHAQWAARPVSTCPDHAVFAIGDAAFAYEPLAGQGVRFAVASAAAAAACCETQRAARRDRPHDFEAAADYYSELVASARRRHLAQLDAQARPPRAAPDPVVAGDAVLQFSAEIVPTGIRVEAQIVAGVGLRLAGGELVRWLGGFDLLQLRELAGAPCAARDLQQTLQGRGLPRTHAEALVAWCLQRGVLAPVAPPSSAP